MTYEKNTWRERNVQFPNRFAKQGETDSSVTLLNDVGVVTDPGTPFSVEWMNHLEQGVEDAHEAIESLRTEEAYGYTRSFLARPSALQLAAWRFLPLEGQVVLISSYQRLCDMMYVGNAANATADWWYKASDAAGAVRDVGGAYMRVLDHRGVMIRPAGQNSKYTMANGSAYDGGSIGEIILDGLQNHWHSGIYRNNPTDAWFAAGTGQTLKFETVSGGGDVLYYIGNVANPPGSSARVAPETRVATVSAFLGIRY